MEVSEIYRFNKRKWRDREGGTEVEWKEVGREAGETKRGQEKQNIKRENQNIARQKPTEFRKRKQEINLGESRQGRRNKKQGEKLAMEERKDLWKQFPQQDTDQNS